MPALARLFALSLAALFAASAFVPACIANCATYTVDILVQDGATGNFLCSAHVTFYEGDAGTNVDGSAALSDAEAAASSNVCQWDVIVGGGSYTVTATAPGFVQGAASLQFSKDRCGSSTAPVTLILERT